MGPRKAGFFHGYYDCYCYLPLYVFCGRHLLAAKLRRSNIDASAGSVGETERIVGQIRKAWPHVRIVLRADSGFAREDFMAWCENNRVDYVFGLARNSRLEQRLAGALDEARRLGEETTSQAGGQAGGKPGRVIRDFLWSTKDSRSRRPRFIVTSLAADRWAGRALYEELYCARGEAENRIQKCQLDLFADRTSTATMAANQLRLWFASFAYVLVCALRRIGLAQTRLAVATCGTIHRKLLKLGAQVRVSVRRVKIAMASACPNAAEFALAHARLLCAAAR